MKVLGGRQELCNSYRYIKKNLNNLNLKTKKIMPTDFGNQRVIITLHK